jgi:hypothetical protein
VKYHICPDAACKKQNATRVHDAGFVSGLELEIVVQVESRCALLVTMVVLGAVMVNVLAVCPKVCGFKPDRGR